MGLFFMTASNSWPQKKKKKKNVIAKNDFIPKWLKSH